ncbi:R-spondin-4 isoform X2 [Poecilia formosa]|nr:PREDICTED: R-spondin-4-like isoform X2 [Poecilia formosa]
MGTAKLIAAGYRWVGELADFRFSTKYGRGKVSADADTLSLLPLVINMEECTEELNRDAVHTVWEGSEAAKKHDVSYVGSLNLVQDSGSTAHRETSEDCQSCLECSRDNGCVRCPERLFLFPQRKGMSHHGTCLHSCPNGHFGQRGRDVNRCMKCRSPDCELCFSRDFCTKCKPGFKLHKGKCLIQCPEGTFAHQTDCLEVCPLPPLGEWSEWSEWSVCVRDGATCGFRWGKQTRVRENSQSGKATEKASVCSPQRETQRCRMKKKCPTEKRRNKKAGLGRKRERKRLRLLASVSANATTDTISGGA